MGLKLNSNIIVYTIIVELKSDQNGIEMHTSSRFFLSFVSLKSDQNGIEIKVHKNFEIVLNFVKIRPKWDWNDIEFIPLCYLIIEVKIRPKWDWNNKIVLKWYQDGELKSDQNGIEMKGTH